MVIPFITFCLLGPRLLTSPLCLIVTLTLLPFILCVSVSPFIKRIMVSALPTHTALRMNKSNNEFRSHQGWDKEMLTTSARPNQLIQKRHRVLALLRLGTQFLREVRARLTEGLARDSQRHKLRSTEAVRRGTDGHRSLREGRSSQPTVAQAKGRQVSGVRSQLSRLSLSETSHTSPTPQPSADPASDWPIAHMPTLGQNTRWVSTLHRQPASLLHRISHSHFTLSQ